LAVDKYGIIIMAVYFFRDRRQGNIYFVEWIKALARVTYAPPAFRPRFGWLLCLVTKWLLFWLLPNFLQFRSYYLSSWFRQ